MPSLFLFLPIALSHTHSLVVDMSTRVRNLLLLVRDVPKSIPFYTEGLGLHLVNGTQRYAELSDGSTTIALKKVERLVNIYFSLVVIFSLSHSLTSFFSHP